MYIQNKPSHFTQREIAAALQIWNRAAISLLDIRHNLISQEEPLCKYRLPASAILYTSGGKAEVLLNDTPYHVERFGLFHGGKGTELTITPCCDWLEYYMVLYHAGEPATKKKGYNNLLEVTNPFRQQYGFVPDNPVFLSELLRKMYEKWIGPTPLALFYGKAAFYQLVYEIYEELEKGHIPILQPDIVAMAQRFLDRSYTENISIQEMAKAFNVSYSHLHRIFSRRVGKSPQEYLTEIRLQACKAQLMQGELSMREIAKGTGFTDEHHLNRMFARHMGTTPGDYRKKMSTNRRDYALGNVSPFPYNLESRVSPGELDGKGATYMLRQMKGKAVVAAALSLMLLLSACGAAPTNASSVGSASTSAVSSQVAEPEAEETRIVKTENGDVEVPAVPKRVIVDGSLRGDVIALGVIPIATQNFYNTGVAYEDLTKETVVLEKWEPEHLMAQNPDLIITIYEEDFDKFSGIAPTVVVLESQLSTVERIALIAQALGKDATEATKIIDAYNQKVVEAKELLEEKGFYDHTFSIIRTGGDNQIDVRWGNFLGGQFLFGEFGLPLPERALAEIEKGETVGDALSFEALPAYMGDYILVNESAEGEYQALLENPIWQSIPAVKENHVFVIPASFLYFGDVYSKSAQLDLIVEKLLEVAP